MKKKILKLISTLLVFLIIFSTMSCGTPSTPPDNTNNPINAPDNITTNEVIIDTDNESNSDTNKVTDILDTETDIGSSTETSKNDNETDIDTSEPTHTCSSSNLDHICDVCGITFEICNDSDNDHLCDTCEVKLSECVDSNKNHECDICNNTVTVCVDSNSDHDCDICDSKLSNCTDTDNNDICDICGTPLSSDDDVDDNKCDNCEDTDKDHNCDICDKALSECADNDNNHNCDTCGKALSECADNDNNHNCDSCGKTLSECADNDNNHNCDICGKALSECADNDNNHNCDICDATLSSCADTDKNHKCDVCEASMNMDKHSDIANDGNHFCDYGCGAVLNACADTNNDHICEECSATISECSDSDANHKCDKCGTTTSQHYDNPTDGNHACDYSGCKAIITSCSDSDINYVCDDCKANITLSIFANGAYNVKFVCGSAASDLDKKIYDEICDLFKSKTGVTKSSASESYTGPAIIIGSTTYAESKNQMAKLTYGAAAANIIGNKYVITYSNPVAAAKMVTALRKLLSSKSATTLTADKSWAISFTDAASRVNQTFDSTGIVSSATLPKYNGAALPTPLYAGQQSYIYINKNATLQHFDNYCAALHVAGFKYYTNNQIGDNQFATYVTNTQIINVMYFKATAEVRITTDVRGTGTNAFDLPKLSGEITTPTPTHSFALTMVEIDNTGYPGGMCFIYRLRNGEFFIVDSGINASGSHTSSAQWIYTTLKKLAGSEKIVVAGWLITHVHSDHLGGLYDMSKDSTITKNMTIKQLIHNEPTDDVTKELDELTDSSANKIWAWMNPIISAFNIKSVIKAHPGQVIRYPGIDITVLASQDVVLDQKASMKDSNDISVITQVSFSGKKILMLGDALKIENAFLAKVYGSNLKSDILQVTHHGYNLTGADPVNKLCAPEIALWSIGQGSDGRDRFEMNLNWSMNTYLKDNVTNYSAKDGNLTFYIYSNTDWRVKVPSPSW